MPRWRASGARAIVTGASSGIGLEIALQLAQAGARVIATARRSDRLSALSEQASSSGRGKIIARPGDITDPTFRASLIDQAVHDFGGLDLLVNNAGIGGIGPFEHADHDRMHRVFDVNFFAPAELTRIALPLLRCGKAPVICNISSVLGHRAVPKKSEYSASKFAMHGWSDALRAELAADGIQVTLVSPSTTASEFFDVAIQSNDPGKPTTEMKAMSAGRVAAQSIRAIERRKDEVILSLGGKTLVYADRLWPWLMNRLVARFG